MKKFIASLLSKAIAPTRECAEDSALMTQFVHFPATTGNADLRSVVGIVGIFVQAAVGMSSSDSTVRSTGGGAGWLLSLSALRVAVLALSAVPSRFGSRSRGLLEVALLLDVARLED